MVASNQKRKPEETWVAVEDYVDGLLMPEDAVLAEARQASAAAGLPDIAVSPSQGKLLHLLARMRGAKRILEIGTLGGYSTIWMARALPPGGRLVTLEYERKHFEVAKMNLVRAGLSKLVEQRLGPAIQELPKLAKEKKGPFDFVFIDADKEQTAEYFAWAVKLAAPGAAIVVDNVVRDGRVADEKEKNEQVRGIRRFLEAAAADGRVSATTIQTVGGKGYDGFTLAVVSPQGSALGHDDGGAVNAVVGHSGERFVDLVQRKDRRAGTDADLRREGDEIAAVLAGHVGDGADLALTPEQ